MVTLKPVLPGRMTGLDLETKSTFLNAYILSGGIVSIDMKKFGITEVARIEMDPDDKEAKVLFHEDPDTVKWWEDTAKDHEWKPSDTAKNISWGGSTPHRAGIESLNRILMQLNKQNSVFTARGPEFDMRIFEQSCIIYGLHHRLRFSNFDSDRTHERARMAMGVPAPTHEEMRNWKIKETVPHTAVYDAAVECYNGARQLWLTAILSLDGREALAKELKNFQEGTFSCEPYLDRVEFS